MANIPTIASDASTESSLDLVVRKARDRFLLQEFEGLEAEPEPKHTPQHSAPAESPRFTLKAQFSPVPEAQRFTAPTDLPQLIQDIDEEENSQLDTSEQQEALQYLKAQMYGLGILEGLLDIPGVTDIFVNGPQDIWYEANGALHRSDLAFIAEPDLRALATRLIHSAGGRLDEAYLSADVLNDRGQRIHAMLPPLSRHGTVLSIRIQPAHRASLEELQESGMFDDDIAAVLRYLVRTKANFLVSGGTGTGKTTLLNAMLSHCEETDRIITIEDSAELAPVHPHVISLQSKAANAEGRGEVSLTELIRQALRMRPERLILGECRGAELADMLTAMNTGHAGSGGTLHANSAAAVPARLLAMGAMAGMTPEALTLQALTAVEYVIHISRADHRRFISEIGVFKQHQKTLSVEPLCRWERGRRGQVLHWTDAGELLKEVAHQQAGGSGED